MLDRLFCHSISELAEGFFALGDADRYYRDNTEAQLDHRTGVQLAALGNLCREPESGFEELN